MWVSFAIGFLTMFAMMKMGFYWVLSIWIQMYIGSSWLKNIADEEGDRVWWATSNREYPPHDGSYR